MADAWVIAEHQENKLKKVSLQAAGAAKKLAASSGGACVGIVLGKESDEVANELACYTEKVLFLEHDLLQTYRTESYAKAIADLVAERKPGYIVMVHTAYMGRDLAPRLAARLNAGCAADCVAIDGDGEDIAFTKPVYAGKAFIKMKIGSSLKVVTVRPNAFAAAEKHDPKEVEKISPDLTESDVRTKVLEFQKTGGERPELTEAEIIVSGGRGIKGPENYYLIEELADTMGAAVGASRAVVDAGWRPHSDQVGQTGKTVSPNLYIACGISGAIQHLAGMSSSKVIVAINTDKEAPIFKVATYGIVGDLFEIVPLLKEEIKQLKAQSS